jgi:hypothetical protein
MGDTKKWLACERCGSQAKKGKEIGDYCGQGLTADWKGIVCGGKIVQFELDRAFIQEGRNSFSREMVELILLDYADYLLKTAACDVNTHMTDYVLTELQAPAIKEWFERLFPPYILGSIS